MIDSTLGHTGVLLGLAASIVGAAVLAVGLLRNRPAALGHGRVYAALLVGGAIVAVGAMEHALVTHDFSLAYVAANNSRETPLLYSITGMWSALEGSILLWGLVLSLYVGAMVLRFRSRATDPLVGWATLVTYLVAAFFFGLMAGPADPFRTVLRAPHDGLGPNVLLQDNPLVAFHPPMLYVGFVGFTIPFAFALAALVTGRMGEGWQIATRRWALFAWGFLTVGIVLGAWWSYQVLGWGGFWAWDPVENASFLPWLTATAFLHSVLVQERRGLLRVWNLSLVVATFCLTILGTFLTRSGVIQSVHAFSNSDIGPLLLGFLAVVLFAGIGLIAWRGDRLRSPGGIDSPLSREGAFLVNNLLFVAFAFVVLLGTVFPLLYEALRGQQVTVGTPYFATMTLPLAIALLFLMAIGPSLPWRKATVGTLADRLLVPAWCAAAVLVACVVAGVRGLLPLVAFTLGAFAAAANLRQLLLAARGATRRGARWWRGVVGRANGGMVVHLGVVVLAVALSAATAYGHRSELTLRPGQAIRFDGHVVQLLGLRDVRSPASAATEVLLEVDGRGRFHPALTRFSANTDPVGTPAVDSGLFDDVYLTVDALPSTLQVGGAGAQTRVSSSPVVLPPGATLRIGVAVQPLVLWLWAGGAILVLGAVLAAVPGSARRRPTDAASAAAPLGGVGATRGGGDREGAGADGDSVPAAVGSAVAP